MNAATPEATAALTRAVDAIEAHLQERRREILDDTDVGVCVGLIIAARIVREMKG